MPNGNREISGGVVGKLSGGRRLGEESLSGNFQEDADPERKASRETFGRATDESGDMAPDEDREDVENREAAGIARFQVAKSGNFWNDADSERKASRETFGRASDER